MLLHESQEEPMPTTTPSPSDAHWLQGIVRLDEAAKLRGTHPATVQRHAKREGQLINVGERAVGVRLWFALMLPDPNAKQVPAKPQPPRTKRRTGERAERFPTQQTE
jgi:hypothetical protein